VLLVSLARVAYEELPFIVQQNWENLMNQKKFWDFLLL
jgi:hypothetical protein